MRLDLPIPQTSIIKGDANSLSIAAASIVAKVTRDQMMEEFDCEYPGWYDFTQNPGYGTAANHLAGLHKLGVTPIHRRSFEPVKSMCEGLGYAIYHRYRRDLYKVRSDGCRLSIDPYRQDPNTIYD